jgi:peptidyl-prolyl cis-trans isomerase B (cyclophilin B)
MTNTPSGADNSETPNVPIPSPAAPPEPAGPDGAASGYAHPNGSQSVAPRTNVFAIVSLVTAFFASLIAVITGHVALRQISRSGEGGKTLAVAGLVLGYLGLVVGGIVLALLAALTISTGSVTELTTSSSESVEEELAVPENLGAPDPAVSEFRDWTGTIALNDTDLEVTLNGENAPIAVSSFLSLADGDYFTDTSCHRVTTAGIFVLQCGDPTGTGTGGPGYSFGPVENAPVDGFYPAGTLAMARVGNDGFSNGSQFFIVYDNSMIPADSAGGYTVFGTITAGLDSVRGIAAAGAQGGGPDGVPAVPAVIGAVSFR